MGWREEGTWRCWRRRSPRSPGCPGCTARGRGAPRPRWRSRWGRRGTGGGRRAGRGGEEVTLQSGAAVCADRPLHDAEDYHGAEHRNASRVPPLGDRQGLGSGTEHLLASDLAEPEVDQQAEEGDAEGRGEPDREPADSAWRPVHEEREGQVAPLAEGDGGPQEGEPDEETHHELLGEGQGEADQVAGDDVDERHPCHHHQEEDASTLFQAVDEAGHKKPPGGGDPRGFGRRRDGHLVAATIFSAAFTRSGPTSVTHLS